MSETVGVKYDPETKQFSGPSEDEAKEVQTVRGLDKVKSSFFAAVRGRGLLNTMLDGPALAFEQANPGMKARWEYNPPNGDNTMVVAREALGFELVDASQLGEFVTKSAQKSGPVRRGDLVLMYGSKELVDMIAAEDAKAAWEDWKLPETTYREHVRSLKVKLSDGTIVEGVPVGKVKRTFEEMEMIADPSQGLATEGGE